MLARTFALILVFTSHAAAACEALVLEPTCLGPLDLSGSPAKVSEEKLRKLFPQYVVKYEIGSGDSPDFHYFEVSTPQGEVLFSIQSFIEEPSPSKKTSAEVPISLLQVQSRRVLDVYGVRVGDHVKDIIAKRGKNLDFGAGHHDALLGGGHIYYSLRTNSEQSPEGFTMQDATKENWEVRSISWPEAAWE